MDSFVDVVCVLQTEYKSKHVRFELKREIYEQFLYNQQYCEL